MISFSERCEMMGVKRFHLLDGNGKMIKQGPWYYPTDEPYGYSGPYTTRLIAYCEMMRAEARRKEKITAVARRMGKAAGMYQGKVVKSILADVERKEAEDRKTAEDYILEGRNAYLGINETERTKGVDDFGFTFDIEPLSALLDIDDEGRQALRDFGNSSLDKR